MINFLNYNQNVLNNNFVLDSVSGYPVVNNFLNTIAVDVSLFNGVIDNLLKPTVPQRNFLEYNITSGQVPVVPTITDRGLLIFMFFN